MIDKDLVSALLARNLGADMLLMLTDVDAVYSDYGTPAAKALSRVAAAEVEPYGFPAGSMGPKIAAAAGFARATGKVAAIGRTRWRSWTAKAARGSADRERRTLLLLQTAFGSGSVRNGCAFSSLGLGTL